FHGSDLNPTPSDGPLRDLLGRWMSQLAALLADGIICVSHGLVKRLWWKGKNARVLPMGVDLEHFKPMDRARCRSELGWQNENVVLFNANNPTLKRLDIADAVMGSLKE